MKRPAGALFAGLLAAACVPADEAGTLGSVEFTFVASEATVAASSSPYVSQTLDGFDLTFDRTVLGFKTMTIGKVGVEDTCSYRGRGESADVVFDPRRGLVQSFNGIKPVDCPDVGIIFGPPGPQTALGAGGTSRDLVDLATGAPAHAIVEVTARPMSRSVAPFSPNIRGGSELKIQMRFDSERTATRFGGCRPGRGGPGPLRGVRVNGGERDSATVRFAAETLFRDALSSEAFLQVYPFFQADTNDDGVVTMEELDALRLRDIREGTYRDGTYRLPNGSLAGSFGDYLRVLFRFAFTFRDENGTCVGNEPGSEEGGQPAPSP